MTKYAMAQQWRGTDDYRMRHRPAGPEYGAPMHDLTASGIYPSDVYSHPSYYTYSAEEREGWSTAARLRGKPDGRVWMYRAIPCEIAKKSKAINEGDWVTTSKEYAIQHGRHPTDPKKDMCVLSRRTFARCLYTEGNSLAEWGYVCPTVNGYLSFRPTGKKKRRNLRGV